MYRYEAGSSYPGHQVFLGIKYPPQRQFKHKVVENSLKIYEEGDAQQKKRHHCRRRRVTRTSGTNA
jgi:hypothetical protein